MNELKEKRKEIIFEAAVYCFNKKGYTDTTLDRIAEKAGMSKGGVYHYFKSKRELFLDLFDFRVNKYFDQIRLFLDKKDTPDERLKFFVKRAGQILKENEDFYRFCLEFLAMGVRDPEIRNIMTEFYRDSIETFQQLIQEGIDVGVFKEIDTEKAARTLYFLVMGAYFTYFSTDPDFDIMEQHSFHINNILRSIDNE